jgi:hypothetical protein
MTTELTGNKNGARAKILRALSESGMLPTLELAEETGLTAKQVRDNCGAARKEGLLTTERDDVTGLAAHKLTTDGREWVKTNLRPRTEDEIATSTVARMAPDLDLAADEPEETANCEIPAEIPASFPGGTNGNPGGTPPSFPGDVWHIVVPHSGDRENGKFSSLENAVKHAIAKNAAATIYRLVEAGRVEVRPVFVPAE